MPRCCHGFSSTRESSTKLQRHFKEISEATINQPGKQPAWKGTVKTGAAISEANRIATAEAKRAARKSPVPRTNTVNAQTLPTGPRCQRAFRARNGLVGHLRT
ncbi:unnamed protein product [Schistocephalus solidus]|uniref:C2H2-type domain-containing protein n=1 Tax=Schistocephalus solidus TaxID=70667 RepID=A0A183STU8_SCHSO|nr:unnamed protein product [Schistocephalus solidus]